MLQFCFGSYGCLLLLSAFEARRGVQVGYSTTFAFTLRQEDIIEVRKSIACDTKSTTNSL